MKLGRVSYNWRRALRALPISTLLFSSGLMAGTLAADKIDWAYWMGMWILIYLCVFTARSLVPWTGGQRPLVLPAANELAIFIGVCVLGAVSHFMRHESPTDALCMAIAVAVGSSLLSGLGDSPDAD